MANHTPIWTLLPGLHGTPEMFGRLKKALPSRIETEMIELPTKGDQHYSTLSTWLNDTLSTGRPRLIIAESFSGPLALRLAALRPSEICGIVLAASFCDAPIHPGIALLPLRPLFMVQPPRSALRHFLIGDDAEDEDINHLRKVVQKVPAKTLTSRVRTVLELQEQDNPSLPNIPMLLLQAQNDNLVPWDAQQRLEACYPKADVHWIESPHLILQRHPEQCLNFIQRFIEGIKTTSEKSPETED